MLEIHHDPQVPPKDGPIAVVNNPLWFLVARSLQVDGRNKLISRDTKRGSVSNARLCKLKRHEASLFAYGPFHSAILVEIRSLSKADRLKISQNNAPVLEHLFQRG